MGTTAQKLTYLNDTKGLLKDSINNLGGSITSQTTFRQYATELDSIYSKLPKITGKGSVISLSPTLKSRINSELYGDTYQKTNLYNNDIEQGAISEGTDVSANNRIRTKGYIEVVPSTQLYIGFSGCDDMYVSYYNSSKTFVSAYGWATGNSNISIPANIYYIRVAFRKSDNSNITPSTISNVQIGNVPNPDYPQDIVSVTGLQKVTICGKNMLDTSSFYKGYVNSSGAVTSDPVQALFDFVRVEPSGTYTISSQETVASLNIVQYDINKNFISRTVQSNNPKTFTLGNTTYYIRIWTKVSDSTPMTQTIVDGLKLMLEKGSSSSTYESYTGNTYEVNLGKNLLDLSKFYMITADSGITLTNDTATGKVTLNGTATKNTFITYSTQKFNSGEVISLSANNSVVNNNVAIRMYDISSAQTSSNIDLNAINKKSEGITLNRSFDGFQIRIASGTTLSNFELFPQLEKGPIATSYSSYFTPIELNKISTYEDRIYKDSGKWYLEKNIQTKTLNGSEYPTIDISKTNTTRLFYNYSLLDYNSKNISCYSNRLSYKVVWDLDEEGFYCDNNSKHLTIRINKSTIGTTSTEINNWLSNNNIIIYCVMATPTTTEITNTTLIQELETLYNAQSKDGTTNISSSSNDLPMVLSVSTLKGAE